MKNLPALRLKKPLEDAVQLGHPWVFRDAVNLPKGLKAGQVVDLLDREGKFLARGTVDPDSSLTFRVWTTKKREKVDGALVRRRLQEAWDLRNEIISPDVTGFRVCHGENDGIPGMQCDLYDGIASLRTDNALGVAWEKRYVQAVREVIKPRAIVIRNPRVDKGKARVIEGEVPETVVISEGSRKFLVHVLQGQKTGFFLDQRDNRTRIERLSAGRRVLNCFAYTGGFSIAAALAGAESVTTVDIAKPAVATARENFTLNKIPLGPHKFLARDAFEVLAEAAENPGEYDLIIVDPPSFAPNRKALPRALKAYEKLNEFALRALPPGGWLATASCSSHIREKDMLDLVARAARTTGRRLTVANVSGAGDDHTGRLHFPEGNYLNFILARVTS